MECKIFRIHFNEVSDHLSIVFQSVPLNNCLDSLHDIFNKSKAWEHNAKDDGFPIYFDGIPYIWLGRRHCKCHQGKDKSKAKRLKYRNKVNSKLLPNHQSIITKTRKLTQPTKKLDCPVTFHVKKIFRFPEFKIDTNAKWNQSVASKKLRNSLELIQTSVSTEQNNQENSTKSKLCHL